MAIYLTQFGWIVDDVFSNLIANLLATALIAIGLFLVSRRFLVDWADGAWLRIVGLNPPWNILRSRRGSARIELLKALKNDQSTEGPHYGQFGRLSSLEEEARYQTGASDIRAKPRMYLTMWPIIILGRRKLMTSRVRLAERGILRLISSGRVHEFQSADEDTSPVHQPSFVSYRHTICAALILCSRSGWSPTVRNVLGAMLDARGRWQNEDGGWAQCDRKFTDSNLFSSVYAARFLDLASRSLSVTEAERRLASAALVSTLGYCRDNWTRGHWKLGEALSEENAPYILVELAPILRQHDPDLLREVLDRVESWLSPSGDLSESYLAKCPRTSRFSLYSRLAYGLLRGGEPRATWAPLFERGLEDAGKTINSAEMAFLIDMTYLVNE